MEVCLEFLLEEDCTSTINIFTTPVIDSTAFSVRSSTPGNEKNKGKLAPAKIAKSSGLLRSSVGSYIIVPQEVRNVLPLTNKTQAGICE